jgi:hypothetical protein
MAENIKHFPVNWIEGMKINKNHFIELQDNIEDIVRDARNLTVNNLNYGLLSTNLSRPFQYSIVIDGHNELSVEIKMLKAITPSGGRIEITDLTGNFSDRLVLQDSDFKENTYFLILNIDPYHRVPYGEQNMGEIPPRFPHVNAKYYLTTLIENEVNQNNIGSLQFPIAKFKTSTKAYEVLTDYIPPCLTVNSHPKLITLFDRYDAVYKTLESSAVRNIQKIRYKNSTEDENAIATMVEEFCKKTVQCVEQQITYSKWHSYSMSPTTIVDNVATLARSLRNCFDTFAGNGKEVLFTYLSEWTNIKSGDFDRMFTETINMNYKSFDIEPAVNQALFFITKMEELYVMLNNLDYIGRKKDTGIFVNENVVKTEKSSSSGNESKNKGASNSSTSFLAD